MNLLIGTDFLPMPIAMWSKMPFRTSELPQRDPGAFSAFNSFCKPEFGKSKSAFWR